MNIAKLKLEIIAKVMTTNDEALLNKIKEILDSYESNSLVNEPTTTYEKIRVFSEEEQRKINLAIQQVENGEYISDEEAQVEIEKWFEEQEKLIDEQIHIFTPQQRKRVLNSLEQSKKGNTMTDEEAQADIQKWL